jgi:hypothetical protein
MTGPKISLGRRLGAALVAGMLMGAAAAGAQPARPSRSAEVVQRELLQVEQEIARANIECNYTYFARVEAAEFIFTDANGGVTTRAEDLAGEKDCRKSTSTTVIDELRVQLHGDVVVLSARSTTTGTSKDGQPSTRRNRFTDVFVWRDARWQLVAGHSSRLPAK